MAMTDELPPAGHDAVTRQHLDERLSAFGAELRSEMGELRGGMGDLQGELRGEMAKHTRVVVLAVVTMNAATIGAVAALLAG